LSLIAVIVIINCSSASLGAQVQIVFTVCKLAALAMIIITGLVRLGQGINFIVENSTLNYKMFDMITRYLYIKDNLLQFSLL